jgi:putative ABC transport system permease protein
MRTLFRRVRYWMDRSRREAELSEELEFHRRMAQERLEQSGMPTTDAAHAGRRTLGNVTLAREDAREVWVWPSLERLWQDVRYAARGLRLQPLFAATAIGTIALGIAATTTVFSVTETELWKPLPFPDVHRLVAAYSTAPGPRTSSDPISGPDFLEWQAQSRSFEQLAAAGSLSRRVLRGREIPEFVTTIPVTAGFFTTLQSWPLIGRPFGPQDTGQGRPVILTDACRQRFFGSDADVLGRRLVLDEETYTIVGVMAPDASLVFMSDPEVFVLMDFAATSLRDRSRRALSVIGRLRPEVTLSSAEAELRSIAARLARDFPQSNGGRAVRLVDLSASSAGYNWRPLYLFMGAALFVLVLSCANVAHLLLARALRRQREFAVRAALGGGYPALVRQLLVEGALLAVPGTAAGLLLSTWAVSLFSAAVPADYFVRSGHVQIDARACAFALAVCCLTTLVFGLAPAVFTRGDLRFPLTAGGRNLSSARTETRVRQALVAGEVMTTFVLVFGAGLFLNSFVQLTRAPLGFDPRDRFSIGVPLTGARYANPRAVLDFSDRLLERTAAVPGVSAVVIATSVPLQSGPIALFGIGGRPLPAAGEEHRAVARSVSPGYFDALSIRTLAGRDFTAEDVAGSQRVVIINETIARRFFGAESAVGRELRLLPGSRSPWLTAASLQIIGVVSNVKDVAINEIEFHNIYVPFAQQPVAPVQLVVKAAVSPAGLADPLRQAILAVDRDLPVLAPRTMEQRVDEALRGDRFHLWLIGTFAMMAIVVASIGVYAAMAYSVQQRTTEFAVRLALGARRSGILQLALGESMRLGLAGTALGLCLSLVLARLMGNALYLVPQEHQGLIYGVTTTDPLTLGWACVILIGVAATAGLLPARRAMRVDPMIALKWE